jgi:hypothetical protein
MKHQRKFWLILTLFLALSVCGFVLVKNSQAASPAYSLDWYVVSAGGTGNTQLGSTIGQNVIGWRTGTYQLDSGFWYAGLKSFYKVYMPLVIQKLPN